MSPTPQEQVPTETRRGRPAAAEGVVVSGMSGLYPNCRNVAELSNMLYNKVYPVTSQNSRWIMRHPELVQPVGKVPGLENFDAQFFRVSYRLGECMDSMSRKVLEQAFQAIYDAGVNPGSLSGKKVGVYIGSCFSETEKACFYVANNRNGLGIAGCNKSMFANRVSYWLNAKGPSHGVDAACSSSLVALEQAYLAIRRGECEAAVVGGSYLCLHPQSSIHYGRMVPLSPDGTNKSFDKNANGVGRSEAVNVLFLQKAQDALRVYATIEHAKCIYTNLLKEKTGPKYGFYRDPEITVEFLKGFYKEAEIPPNCVEFVEAFGSAVPEADKSELQALSEVFCEGRSEPLSVGSVMSNIGYTEGASGISAVTKVLLGYHRGLLAGNLHVKAPRDDVPAVREGRLRVLTDHQPCRRQYIAVNSLSFSGVNGHVLFKGFQKEKDTSRYKSEIPHLVAVSGRHDAAVRKILDELKSHPIDPEQLALLHNVHQYKISGHLARGFTILDTNEKQTTICLSEKAVYADEASRPLWFVYSGMGSQWPGMGTQLMRVPTFRRAILRCQKALSPVGVDVIEIITSPDKSMFDNILHSFVGIAAVQIGLTDVLLDLGLVPDKIIGHSVGELGCAYADGCLTAEEMILAAYSRGLVSIQTPFIRGSMAAVGIGFQQMQAMIPPEIEVACHNGPNSCTISGPADAMRSFVAELTARGVFAKEVPCSNIAYHSRYIAEAGPGLLKLLSEVIPEPRRRSERWLSTSVPQERWTQPLALYSSAEYHTNNLLSSVLFEETSRLIPASAVLVEVAPHGLLQAILKRSLPDSCTHVPLTRRGHPDNALFLLQAIGKLHIEGYDCKIQSLYPKIEFPVSTGTPLLSPLVEWAHGEKWTLPLFSKANRKMAASCKYVVSVHDEEHKYLNGNVIKGWTLYPPAAALVATWDTLAMSRGVGKKQLSVQFHDVHLRSQPVLHARRQLRLHVALHAGTGRFEVLDDFSILATGFITTDLDEVGHFLLPSGNKSEKTLSSQDIYQLMQERDYSYSGEFRSIHSASTSLTQAELVWSDNWVTFVDGLLQLNALRQPHDSVSQPAHIMSLKIDLKEHNNNHAVQMNGKTVMEADIFELLNFTRCGGVLLENVRFHPVTSPSNGNLLLKCLKFVPRFASGNINLATALQVHTQIVTENINKNNLKITEIINYKNFESIFDIAGHALRNIPGVEVELQKTYKETLRQKEAITLSEADIVVVHNIANDDSMCQLLYRILPRDVFVINITRGSEGGGGVRARPSMLFRVVSAYSVEQSRVELVRWRATPSTASSTAWTEVHAPADLDMLKSTRDNMPATQKLVILTRAPHQLHLKRLVQQWRKEPVRNQVYLIAINHAISNNQDLDELPDLDLAFNVLDHGSWGGEYFVPVEQRVSTERGVMLQSGRVGDVDSLHWVEAPEPEGRGVAVQVHYAGLNVRDAKRATAMISLTDQSDNCYGMDFSGISESGSRVMGVCVGGSCSTRVRAAPTLTWPVPAHWSLEDAATVPLPYAQALYCLAVRYELLPGMYVLVHGGTGALGQAVISVALANNCHVFTTVSDAAKKHFLRKLFPQLKEDHIGNSRDHNFGDMVLHATKGVGCDMIISCARGELKTISLNCLSRLGIFFDMVQLDDQENYNFGMFYLTKERNYVTVDFSSVLRSQNIEEIKKLQSLMSEGISRGYVRPLSRVTYAPHEAGRALRLLAGCRHRGRVLLRLHHAVLPPARPRLMCCPDSCHLIVCDEEAFGLNFCDRLVSRGARKLRLHCPRYFSHLNFKIQSWQKQGVEVEVSSENLADFKSVYDLFNKATRLGPLEGIYAFVSDTSDKDQDLIINSLDLASRKLGPSIKYFAVLSTGRNAGRQTCISRAQHRLPASMLQLPTLRKLNVTDVEAVSWRHAIDATEIALRSMHPILLAHTENTDSLSFLQKIATVAGIDIPENTPPTTTLDELGVDEVKAQAISAHLRHAYNLIWNIEEVILITVARLKTLGASLEATDGWSPRGLAALISHVASDELLATADLVSMPTLVNDGTTRYDEYDFSVPHLLLVPGLEGHHERFRTLCERLKVPAFVLQPGLDQHEETITELADRYVKIILRKTEVKNNFYILGYETGVLVALETAAILEKQGMSGTIYCLGGTPEDVQASLEEQLRFVEQGEGEAALQDAVARHLCGLMCEDGSPFDVNLSDATTWPEKVDVCVRTLRGRMTHATQYARGVIEAAYVRIGHARRYKTSHEPLRSRVVLLRASASAESASAQHLSLQPVAEHRLQSPLHCLATDLRCATIVNGHLDEQILESFETINRCDSYLIDGDIFMKTGSDLVAAN